MDPRPEPGGPSPNTTSPLPSDPEQPRRQVHLHSSSPSLPPPEHQPRPPEPATTGSDAPPIAQARVLQNTYNLVPQDAGGIVEATQLPPNLSAAASAAVTALSELARFAGTMDAAERALAALSPLGPMVGHFAYAAGAVERQWRGNLERIGGPIDSVHGRDSFDGASEVTLSGEASKSLGNDASNRRQQIAWCELCQVRCNSFEILEQHKNGKRHKKNLQRIGELKKVVSADAQNQGTGIGAVLEGLQEHEKAQQGEANPITDGTPCDMDSDNKPENGCDMAQPPCGSMELSDHSLVDNKDQGGSSGKKHKIKGSKTVAKRVKIVPAPVVCEICNVKCDTREVFDRHLSGKKHISKVKRSERRQPMHGKIGLQAVYPYNSASLPQGHAYPYLGPQGSFLPPQPQAFMSLPLQAHCQGIPEGNASLGSFQRSGPQAPEAAVSFNGTQNIVQQYQQFNNGKPVGTSG